MIKFKELFKKPITYFVLGALVVATSVLCGVLPLIAKPKPRPAITAEQKEFLQSIATTQSSEPEIIDFSYDTSVLSETQEITQVHYISQNLMVATITNSADDSSFIYLVETNRQTTTLTQIVSSTDYSFSSLNGNCLVLTNRTDRTQALYGTSMHAFVQAAGVYNSITPLSDGYFLLSQAVTTGDPNYDDYNYYNDLSIAKISGSSLTICATQTNAFDCSFASNFVAINSVNKFSLYFLTEEGATEEFTYDNNARGQSIQDLIVQGFEPLVQDFTVEQINSASYHLNLELMGTATHYTYAYNYGDGIYYYNIANYLVSVSDCSVTITDDQINTYSYKTFPNDCYQQTITTPDGKTTTSYHSAEGKKVWSPSFEIIHSFGDTFIASDGTKTALYDLNMKVLLDFQNTSYFAFYNNLIVYVKDAYGYLADTKGNQIITSGCDQITAEIDGKVLFGYYNLIADEEDNISTVWTWKFIDTTTLEITDAENIKDEYSTIAYLQPFYVENVPGYYSFNSVDSLILCKKVTFFREIISSTENCSILLKLENGCYKKYSFVVFAAVISNEDKNSNNVVSTSVSSSNYELTAVYNDSFINNTTIILRYGRNVYFPENVDKNKFLTEMSLDLATNHGARHAYFEIEVPDYLRIYAFNVQVPRYGYGIGSYTGNVPNGRMHVIKDSTYSYYALYRDDNHVPFSTTWFDGRLTNSPCNYDTFNGECYYPDTSVYNSNTLEYENVHSLKAEDVYSIKMELHRRKNTWSDESEGSPTGIVYIDTCERSIELYSDGSVWKTITRPYGFPFSHECSATLASAGEPNKTGYTFEGWYYNNKKVEENDISIYSELTAHWTPNPYTVTYDLNTISTTGANLYKTPSPLSPSSKTVTFDSTYGDLPTPTCTAYDFAGWWTTANNTGMQVTSSSTVSTASDHTLYAHWTPTTYSIYASRSYAYWMDDTSFKELCTYTIEDGQINIPKTSYSSGGFPSYDLPDVFDGAIPGSIFDHWKVISAPQDSGFSTGDRFNNSGHKITFNKENDATDRAYQAWSSGKYYGNITVTDIFDIPIYSPSPYGEYKQIGYKLSDYKLSDKSAVWYGSEINHFAFSGKIVKGENGYFTAKFSTGDELDIVNQEGDGWTVKLTDGNQTSYLTFTMAEEQDHTELNVKPALNTDTFNYQYPIVLSRNYDIFKYEEFSQTLSNYDTHWLAVPKSDKRIDDVAHYLSQVLSYTPDSYEIGREEFAKNAEIPFEKLGELLDNIHYEKAIRVIQKITITIESNLTEGWSDIAEKVGKATSFNQTETYNKWFNTNAEDLYSNNSLSYVLLSLNGDNSAVIETPIFKFNNTDYYISEVNKKVNETLTGKIGKDFVFTDDTTIQITFEEVTTNYISIYTFETGEGTIAKYRVKSGTKVAFGRIEADPTWYLLLGNNKKYQLPSIELTEGTFTPCGLIQVSTEIPDFADILITSKDIIYEITDLSSKPYIYVVYQRVVEESANP